uniref:Uncharacterized protein n=1 Tax=Arundo donax TaxID=35708 RepID=A0A0A8Z491_ARUDO
MVSLDHCFHPILTQSSRSPSLQRHL